MKEINIDQISVDTVLINSQLVRKVDDRLYQVMFQYADATPKSFLLHESVIKRLRDSIIEALDDSNN